MTLMFPRVILSVLQKWPSSGQLRDFQQIQQSFFQSCKELSLRLLRLMALSLDLDPDVFLSAHRLVGGTAPMMPLGLRPAPMMPLGLRPAPMMPLGLPCQ